MPVANPISSAYAAQAGSACTRCLTFLLLTAQVAGLRPGGSRVTHHLGDGRRVETVAGGPRHGVGHRLPSELVTVVSVRERWTRSPAATGRAPAPAAAPGAGGWRREVPTSPGAPGTAVAAGRARTARSAAGARAGGSTRSACRDNCRRRPHLRSRRGPRPGAWPPTGATNSWSMIVRLVWVPRSPERNPQRPAWSTASLAMLSSSPNSMIITFWSRKIAECLRGVKEHRRASLGA